jgi:hypothetical protein
MSLEYYLFCRKKYDDILYNIENILYSYEHITEQTFDENMLDPSHNDIFKPYHNIQYFIEQKEVITQIRKNYELKINAMCNHEMEDDLIDITPDESKHISYCTICGFTK